MEGVKTVSQLRAKKAYDLLSRITVRSEEFRQFCKSFPAMIVQNGLGAALAFIKAKAKDEAGDRRYSLMYETLNGWLRERKYVKEDVLKEIIDMDAQRYVEIQEESLKFLEWVKRFECAGLFDGMKG